MLSSYDLSKFSSRLKSIRKTLGYAQLEVSESTGINSDTLRRLENGLSIPRFDTLEVLSQFYKVNLILLLDSYKISSQLSYYYDLIDYYMINNDTDSITRTIQNFEENIIVNEFNMVDIRDIEQLKLFFIGLKLSYQSNNEANKDSLNYLVKALQISNPLFIIDNWQSYKYNFLELRILFTIASIEGHNRNCAISNNILLMILSYLDTSKYAKHYEKVLVIKSYAIMSYNYHRLDNHQLALEYSEKGIQFCIDNSIMTYLALLLSRKGMAMYHLKMEGYQAFILQAIELLRIQKNDSLAKEYEAIALKYLDSDPQKEQ
jgi:transcriptional regulator with XRE-family HTH domain